MLKHIVAWNYAEGLSEEENKKNALNMKRELESLKSLIPEIKSIQVLIKPTATSDADILLDSVFENEEDLKTYTVHPEHVRVGTNFVKPFVTNRRCFDLFTD
jgi:hypothetical protein